MAFDMANILQPGRVAVLLSEVQRSVVGDRAGTRALAGVAREVGLIERSAVLAGAARERAAPVVHCLASTAPGRFGANTNARLFKAGAKRSSGGGPPHDPAGDVPCPEVWREGDILSPRDHGLSPMADSQLDSRLRNRGIQTVIVAGVSLNVAILNLAMEAVNRAYQVIVARDAVAGLPRDYAEPVIANSLSMIATVATTEEIIAAWPRASR
jgi:nicotinamidase-related amidase